ncbi:MAG: putative amylopullulanase, partial [Chloroflexi bacterium]|nr:putative amylopullulanase [Chloroflexota bacterium]
MAPLPPGPPGQPGRRHAAASAAVLLAGLALLGVLAAPGPLAADGPVGPPTPEPAPLPIPVSVTLVGTLLPDVSNGTCEAWDARCPATALVPLENGVWATRLAVPAGTWRWRAALDGDTGLSFGQGSRTDGPDRVLQLASEREVTFVFDEETRSVADSVTDPLAFAVSAGDDTAFACPPATVVPAVEPCLANLLTDPDGDGVATVARRVQPGTHRVSLAFAGEGEGATGPALEPLEIEATATDPVATVAFDGPPRTATAWAGDGQPGADERLDPFGFGHDSRDATFRAPAGAVPAGSAVRLRFRAFAGDATAVTLRLYDAVARRETLVPMTLEAAGIACGDPVVEARAACDWWVAIVTPPDPTTLTYRFVVEDGPVRRYYADDAALDGGRGAVSRTAVDAGWTVTVHVPGFEPLPWLAGAIVYQVFPDRLANGDTTNDLAETAFADPPDARYGWPPDAADRDESRDWLADLPETPARGRDWFGGDLPGLEGQLDRLAELGVEALYLNPVFSAASNHAYDTRDYRAIDPRFGTEADWRSLVAAASAMGIRIVLDGVFNHVSADSPWFDRDGHFGGEPGACESVDSPYRGWFTFMPQAGGPCAGPDGPNTMGYEAWSGYASLPVLRKDTAGVRDLVYEADDAVAREWLRAGAAGWRLDVMMDPSFGSDFWP